MSRNFAGAIVYLIMAVIINACAGGEKTAVGPSEPTGIDPRNAVYDLQGRTVPLVDGRFSAPAAPGSASRITANLIGRPLIVDLDRDGDDDAVVVIVYDPGGSGTFYYIAAAINKNGAYYGTRGHLLGDRIIVQTVSIDNGLVLARYLDRRPNEPMSAPPTIRKELQLRFSGDNLIPLNTAMGEEQVQGGWVTIGHEVRSFLPCSENNERWLLGGSPALYQIKSAYRKTLPRARPYTALFMHLAGHDAPAPSDGFGADYSTAFYATRLVEVRPAGNCRQEFIVVKSPKPGTVITSPLHIRGMARGSWFFEGDFPLILKDRRGRVIARGYVTAKGDWMTKAFVPFEGILKFKMPTTGHRGSLVFKKDNPSDRPELDDSMELPIRFRNR